MDGYECCRGCNVFWWHGGIAECGFCEERRAEYLRKKAVEGGKVIILDERRKRSEELYLPEAPMDKVSDLSR